jgi:effector-binding domain-containing protein/uncharacterized protein YndB with AHSA1/START domain
MEVRRVISIDVPIDAVYNQVANFENWTKWDAKYEQDSSQNRTYNGSVGDQAYGFKWQSENEAVGNGAITMNAVEHNERLDFTYYFKNTPTRGYFTFNSKSGTTEVEWVIISELSYPMKIVNYFINGIWGDELETGLENLKDYTEKTAIAKLSPNISPILMVEEHGVNYALIQGDSLSTDLQSSFLVRAYKKIFTHIQTHGLMPNGSPRGLYYGLNEEHGTVSLAAAVPISKIRKESEVRIDSEHLQLYLGSNYIRGIAKGGKTDVYHMHTLLNDWIVTKAKNLKMPVVEEYLKGPNEVQDTSQYATNVIYYFE